MSRTQPSFVQVDRRILIVRPEYVPLYRTKAQVERCGMHTGKKRVCRRRASSGRCQHEVQPKRDGRSAICAPEPRGPREVTGVFVAVTLSQCASNGHRRFGSGGPRTLVTRQGHQKQNTQKKKNAKI